MADNGNGLSAVPRRIEPVDVTNDKTQVVLDEGRPDRAELPEPSPEETRGVEGVTIQSVDRALSILEFVATAPEPVKLHEIAEALNLKSPTCYHLLNSLVRRDFISRNAHPRSYQLGPRIGEIARRERAQFDIRRAVIPHLVRLRERTGHTACLAVFSGTELTVAAEAEAAEGVRLSGYRAQLNRASHASALGKAILAWLPEPQIARVIADRGLTGFTDLTIVSLGELVESLRQVRRHGFAVDAGEYQSGVYSLAAAVRDPSGGVIGSVGCLAARQSDDLPALRDMQHQVSATAKEISDMCR